MGIALLVLALICAVGAIWWLNYAKPRRIALGLIALAGAVAAMGASFLV